MELGGDIVVESAVDDASSLTGTHFFNNGNIIVYQCYIHRKYLSIGCVSSNGATAGIEVTLARTKLLRTALADRSSRTGRGRSRWPVVLVAALGLIALAAPGPETAAQAIAAEDGIEDAQKKTPGAGQTVPLRGAVYTWQDGDRTLRAFLQSDLVVRHDGAGAGPRTPGARAGPGMIARVARAAEAGGQPVFRSSSGALMTLPGGVLLVFDRDWRKAETDAFLASRGIARNRVSPLGAIPNGFVVATGPGFAALELANALAGEDGVVLSSPNWWKERTTR